MLRREGQRLLSFTHPHLVRAYEVLDVPRPAWSWKPFKAKRCNNSSMKEGGRWYPGSWPAWGCTCARPQLPAPSPSAAPGPETVQHHLRLRAGQAHRLEPGPAARAGATRDGHSGLPLARTGHWRSSPRPPMSGASASFSMRPSPRRSLSVSPAMATTDNRNGDCNCRPLTRSDCRQNWPG